MQALWRETLVSFVLIAWRRAGRLSAGAQRPRLVLQLRRPTSWPRAAIRTATTAAAARDPLRRPTAQDGLSVFATFLFTHNAQIALFAFALGFALCLPTAALMVMNGGMLGRLPGPVRLARAWASRPAAG